MTHIHLHLQTIHDHLNGEDILHRGLHAHQDHLQGQQDQEHTQGHLHVLHIGKKTSDQGSTNHFVDRSSRIQQLKI